MNQHTTVTKQTATLKQTPVTKRNPLTNHTSGKYCDTVHKNFWQDPEHFADVVNAVIFNGEKVLIPEELQEVDSDVSQVIQLQELTEHLARRRDVVKSTPMGETFAIIGIENQTAVHYAMPLRTLLYDVLGYTKECTLLAKKNTKTKHSHPRSFV